MIEREEILLSPFWELNGSLHVMSFFCYYLSLEKGETLYFFLKTCIPFSWYVLSQVWLKYAQWFWIRNESNIFPVDRGINRKNIRFISYNLIFSFHFKKEIGHSNSYKCKIMSAFDVVEIHMTSQKRFKLMQKFTSIFKLIRSSVRPSL